MKIMIKNKMKGEGDKTTVSSLSKKHGLSELDVENLLSTGITVELEHTKDREVAAEIAIDHLTEDIDYYKKLKEAGLADELEKSKNPKKTKFEYVMKEFSDGNLKSSSGDIVTDRKQALAIAYSESGMKKSAIDWSDRLRKLFIRRHGSSEDKKQLKIEQLEDENFQNVEALKKQKISFSSTRNYKDIVDPSAEYDRKYRLQGKKTWNGLVIAIENKKGSYRKGKDPNGKAWKTYMNYDYGRINGTKASDDEYTDIYIGPDDTAEIVYVVHQVDPWTKKYDEDKCLINFPSKEAAIKGYLSQYNRPDFLGDVSEFTIEEFKQALKDKKGAMLYKSPILIKSESFTPPQEVRNVAKRVLEAKDKYGSDVKGGTSIGWGRARQLANGESLSMETINRMVSFFARHEGNQDTNGETWYKDAGRVAWMLWGGDPGKRWANSIAKQNMKKSQRIVIRRK